MSFLTDTLARAAFKRGLGKGHTGSAKDLANEAEASFFNIAARDVYADRIPNTPAAAISAGVSTILVSLTLTLDPSSLGKAYFASITTVSGSPLQGKINPRTGVAFVDGDRVGFLIPPQYGVLFRAILKNNGTEVAPSSTEDWFIDYVAGIVTSEDNLSLINGTLEAYVYIGRYLDAVIISHDVLTAVSDGYGVFTKGPGGVDGYSLVSGNVGVGVTTPQQKFHVNGNIRLGTSNSNTAIMGDGILSASGDTDVLVVANLTSIAGTPTGDIIFGAGSASAAANATFAALFPASLPRLEYMRIEGSTGHVGIGTTNPDSNLHIFGGNLHVQGSTDTNLLVATAASDNVGIGSAPNASDKLHLRFKGDTGPGTDFRISRGAGTAGEINEWTVGISHPTVAVAAGSLLFRLAQTAPLGTLADIGFLASSTTGGTIPDVIIKASGRVGIGTASPSTTLHIVNTLGFRVEETGATGRSITAVPPQAAARGTIIANSANGLAIGVDAAGQLAFRTNSTDQVTILSTGLVGIGTTVPGYNLHVGAGNQTATNVANTRIVVANSTVSQRAAFIALANDAGSVKVEAQFEASGNEQRVIMGSSTNHEVQLRTNNSVRMTTLGSGLIGIGTTVPVAAFNLYGNDSATQTTFTQALTSATLLITSDFVNNNFTPGLFWSTQDNNPTKPKAGIYPKLTSSGSYIYLGTSNSYLTGITNDAMVIRYDGNVGIGSADPAFPLQVVRGVNSNTTLEVENTTSGTLAYSQFSSTVTTGSMEMQAISTGYTTSGLTIANTGRLHTSSGLTGGMVIVTDAAAPMIFGTGNAERMRILSTGLVGIGVTNPAYDLQIGVGTVTNGAQQKVVLANFTNNERSSFSNVAKDSGGISVEGIFEASGTEQRVILGAITNHEVQLRTNNAVRITVLETGEVGIGSTTPTERLEISNGSSAIDIFVAKENTTKVFVLPDAMAAPSVSSQVLYATDTSGTAAWGHINNLRNDRHDLSFYNFEEFVGWNSSTVPYGIYEPFNSGGSVSIGAEDANHPGVARLLGGDPLDRMSLKTTSTFYGPSGSQRYDLQCLVYFDTVTQTSQNWAFKFGLSDNYFADVDGMEEVSISIDAGSNSFRAKVIANSVVTYNSTIGVTAVAGTWYKMSIAFVNGIAVMTINGTVESTGSVTTPTLGPMMNLISYTKVTGTSNYSCYVDYSSILVTGLTR